jgi:hypothetical protein
MKWVEIRIQYPQRFVLVEAIKTVSINRKRTIEEMTVVEQYQENDEAWNGYKHFHKQNPQREFYIFHTSNENVEVIDEQFLGIRGI